MEQWPGRRPNQQIENPQAGQFRPPWHRTIAGTNACRSNNSISPENDEDQKLSSSDKLGRRYRTPSLQQNQLSCCLYRVDEPTDSTVWRFECSVRVGSHLGLRISESEWKKPSNVRVSANDILTFDGSSSLPVAGRYTGSRRARRSSGPARPYIIRLSVFRRLICPSV
jgi:hypothetical protein